MSPLDESRCFRVTASMLPVLMNGNPDDINNLFLRGVGDPRYIPSNFSNTWPAKFGLVVEGLALDHHGEKTGQPITERGVQYFHPSRAFVSCTLDGFREADKAVIDCKCINGTRDIDEALAYYTPQLIVQQECRQADRASLLVVKGGAEPIEVPAYITDWFRAEVWDTADRFQHCLETLTPPYPLHFPRIVAPSEWRRIDLDNDESIPNWAPEMRELLSSWQATHKTAQFHEKVKTEIRALVADDVGEIVSSCFRVKRDRRNAISIRQRKTWEVVDA